MVLCGRCLGQDVRQLGRGRDLDKPHCPILDDFMREVLPDVNVLGPFSSADDVVAPFDARGVVLVYQSRLLLGKSQLLQQVLEVENLRRRS